MWLVRWIDSSQRQRKAAFLRMLLADFTRYKVARDFAPVCYVTRLHTGRTVFLFSDFFFKSNYFLRLICIVYRELSCVARFHAKRLSTPRLSYFFWQLETDQSQSLPVCVSLKWDFRQAWNYKKNRWDRDKEWETSWSFFDLSVLAKRVYAKKRATTNLLHACPFCRNGRSCDHEHQLSFPMADHRRESLGDSTEHLWSPGDRTWRESVALGCFRVLVIIRAIFDQTSRRDAAVVRNERATFNCRIRADSSLEHRADFLSGARETGLLWISRTLFDKRERARHDFDTTIRVDRMKLSNVYS